MRKKIRNEDTRYSSTQQGKSVLRRYEQRLIVSHWSSQTVIIAIVTDKYVAFFDIMVEMIKISSLLMLTNNERLSLPDPVWVLLIRINCRWSRSKFLPNSLA